MIEINNTTKNRINQKKLLQVVQKFIQVYRLKDFSVSIAIIGDQKMRALNMIYRGQNKTTDVLSFTGINEIIINYAQIKRQAVESHKTVEAELLFILVHGLLHLIGFNDDTEKQRLKMIHLGEVFLRKI